MCADERSSTLIASDSQHQPQRDLVEWPLSINQQQLWFECQLDPESCLYNLATRLEIVGPLDAPRFLKAVAAVIHRHDIIRTVFPVCDDKPVQRVLEDVKVPEGVIELPLLEESQAEKAVLAHIESLIHKSFDLSTGPLFRAELIRCSPATHHFVFVFHHLILDAFYCGQLLQEIVATYESLGKGEVLPLAPRLQYGDFCRWSEDCQRRGLLDASRLFWRNELAEPLPEFHLPLKKKATGARNLDAGMTQALPVDTVADLRALAKNSRTTLFRVIVAVLAVLFRRWSEGNEVMFDIDFSMRPRQMARTIGCYANLLPVRIAAGPEQTFAETVALVDAKFRQLADHKTFPARQLAKTLKGARRGTQSLSSVMVTQIGTMDWSVGGMHFAGNVFATASYHDLWVTILDRGEIVELTVGYSEERLDAMHVHNLLAGVQALVREVTANPRMRINETTNTSRAAVIHSSASESIENICALSPSQQEIFSAVNKGSYAQQAIWTCRGHLDEETLKQSWELLVHRYPILRTVFNCARKQPAQIVLAHLPLSLSIYDLSDRAELEQPEEWRSVLTKELNSPFDLAAGPLFRVSAIRLSRSRFRTLLTFHPILLDCQSAEMILADAWATYHALLDGRVPAENDSRPIEDFLLWLKRNDSSAASEYWRDHLADAAGKLFPGDHQGCATFGRARIPISLSEGVASSLKELARRCGVSVITIFQAAWAILLGRWCNTNHVIYGLAVDGRPKELKGSERMVGKFARVLPLRIALRTSEPLADALRSLEHEAAKVSAYAPFPLQEIQVAGENSSSRRLFNAVFAEPFAGVHSSDFEFLGGQDGSPADGPMLEVLHDAGWQLAIVYPQDVFEHTTMQVLATTFQRLLENMVGSPDKPVRELEIISSEERTRVLSFSQGDVLKDEKLRVRVNASSPPVWSGVYVLDQERRLLPVGCFGEIAVGAPAEPEPSCATEKSVPNPFAANQDSRLWFTAEEGRWTNDGRLQLLAELLTPVAAESYEAEYVAPRTDLEKTVAAVWKEVLEISRVGLKDDFFDLGGHSLKTIQARSRLSQRLGISVPLKVFFSHRVLEAQAQAIAALKLGPVKPGQSIPRLPAQKYYPVSYAQRRLWFLHRLDPNDHFFHTADCISLEGPLDRLAFEQAFQALCKRHEMLRTSFRLIADEPVQYISENFPELRFDDLSSLGQDEQTAQMDALREEMSKLFSDLEVPPVGALLVKLAENKHVFILAVHHILSDQWSGLIVWRDLLAFYSAACRKQPPQLPAIQVRYADYAVWQKERIQGGELAESERYWRERLRKPLPKLKLHQQRSQDQAQVGDVLAETIESSPELSAHLARLGQAEDATPFMVRLAIFKAFLARITGQTDILVGSTTAGRDHPDIEPLVGFFVNVAALRTSLDADLKLAEIVKRVKKTCVEAYAHQEYPFDLLVQQLAPVRDGHQLPMLEAFFVDIPSMQSSVIEGVRFTTVDFRKEKVDFAGRKLPVPMGMICQETEGSTFTWCLLFRADAFDQQTAQRLARQFGAFLASLAQSPEAALSELNIVPSLGKEFLLQHLVGREEYPLSLNQRDMWFQEQVNGEPGLNRMAAVVSLSGPLNAELFRQALQAVVDRHDALRTLFCERNGVPFQRILATVPVTLPVLEFSTADEEEHEALIQKRQDEIISAPFDFAAGPLFRAELLTLRENRHVLLFAFSHLILDGISMAEVLEQVATAYGMLLEGRPATFPPLDWQYPDFATWQDQRLAQGLLEQHYGYWQEQLQPPLPTMSLPSDRDVRSVRSFEVNCLQWQVRDDVFHRLKTFPKRYRTTMFRIVVAAFQVLLRKIVGEKEVSLGIPFSFLYGSAPQTVGFFAQVVPIRIHLDDRQPFTTVLNQLNLAIGRAQEHHEYPVCEAVRGMQIKREPHRPLFPVIASQIKDLDRTVGGLRMRLNLRPIYAGVFHLGLAVLEGKQGLDLTFYYNRELLEGRPLAIIQECFNELLSQVAATPEVPIADLGIVSTAEQEKVLKSLAGAISAPAEQGNSVVARIEDHVRRRPQATAASCGSAKYNYDQLNQRANRMARWLREQGIGRESRIGIFGERGLEMLTTLLAVLKAGAAFVPLDPDHPDARLKSILEKVGLSALATSADLVARSHELTAGISRPPQVICWHELSRESRTPNPALWACQPASNLEVGSRLDDLAYVCYTSGSTGVPKGAMVEHRGMLNHLLAKIGFLGLDEQSVVAQNASHCFDISIWQFLAALLVGGRVVIYPSAALSQLGSMLQFVDRDDITVLETVPSLLETMLNQAPPELVLPRLKHVISNAEELPVLLCRRWKTRFPHVAIMNTYGSTECSDDTTHHRVEALKTTMARIPVGKSIPGAQHYVLGQELRTVPAGCAGQIAIAGDVVGRGYLGDPVTTARAFVPNPFRSDGSRLYLTGDQGRWNSAGELEFLGRMDNQIKLHGQRVELGEIEAALGRLAGVCQTVVVLSEEEQRRDILAYWVGEPTVDSGKLHDHARKELPAFMVPNTFIQMTTLPLTPNGKVDRQALPKPTDTQNGRFMPPRDEIEFKLAELWRTELDVSAVSVFDNFFEHGGHSLKAVSLLTRVQTEFHVSLPLRTLFDHQTIDSLARLIREGSHDSGRLRPVLNGLVPLQPRRSDSTSLPLFLVHPHGGTVFCYQALAAALGDGIPVFGIQCRGLEEGEQPHASIPEMARTYVRAIYQAQPQGPYHIAGWSLGGPIAFEIARQLEASDGEVAFLGVFDSVIPSSTGKSLEHLLPDIPSREDVAAKGSMARFARWFFRADERQFDNLSDSQTVDALREMAQRAGMLPPDTSAAMLKRFVAVATASTLAFYQYRPAGPVRTDLVLFRAAHSLVDDPRVWAPWTRGRVQTVPVAGTHYDMVVPPAVHTLAAAIKKYLFRVVPAANGDGNDKETLLR